MHTRRDVADDDASAEVPAVSRSRAAAVFPASCFSAHPAATAYNRYNGTAPPSGGHHRGKRHVQDAGRHAGAFCPFSSSPFPHAGTRRAVFSPARHVPAPTRATRPTGRKSGISPRLTIHDTSRFSSFFPDRFHRIQTGAVAPEKNRFFCNGFSRNSISRESGYMPQNAGSPVRGRNAPLPRHGSFRGQTNRLFRSTGMLPEIRQTSVPPGNKTG